MIKIAVRRNWQMFGVYEFYAYDDERGLAAGKVTIESVDGVPKRLIIPLEYVPEGVMVESFAEMREDQAGPMLEFISKNMKDLGFSLSDANNEIARMQDHLSDMRLFFKTHVSEKKS
ncbi:MAG: hypothetical protein WC455_16580 [Dehalococcoidia bacterium]